MFLLLHVEQEAQNLCSFRFFFPFIFLPFFFAFFVVASGWETYSLTEEVWLEKIALYLKLRIILFLFEVL